MSSLILEHCVPWKYQECVNGSMVDGGWWMVDDDNMDTITLWILLRTTTYKLQLTLDQNNSFQNGKLLLSLSRLHLTTAQWHSLCWICLCVCVCMESRSRWIWNLLDETILKLSFTPFQWIICNYFFLYSILLLYFFGNIFLFFFLDSFILFRMKFCSFSSGRRMNKKWGRK